MRLLSALSVLLLIITASASASELEEILKSKEMKRYKKAAIYEEGNLRNEKWLPADENFSLIFAKKNGWLYVNKWLDIPATGEFRRGDVQSLNTDRYVHSIREYRTKDNQVLLLEVYIPHPRYRETAHFGLIEKMAERSPPQLRVEFTEDTEIKGHKGKLYTLPKGQCQVNIPLDLQTLVIFSAPCSHTDDLLELGRHLSFDRFIMKLNT